MADWKEQALRLWHKLGKKERYIIIGLAVLLFTALMAWSYWWGGRPEYVPLFTNLDAKDAGEVSAKLKELKIQHEIGSNGTAIMVPAKDVYRIRLDLASQGLPRGNKGFEVFDQNKFGVTEFQNKVYLLQALQGELARTIEQMAEVEKARVHIVLPEDSLYKKNEKPASASIMLKLKPSAQLSREQVRGIVNLVAHSIQGLKPENITVVDNFARVLNEQTDSNGFVGSGTMTQIEMTKKVREDLQKSIQSLLEQVLGPGKAAARVNVELNFDQHTIDRQKFEPVIDDKGIIRSSHEVTEGYKGGASAPGGPAGTASNIPGYVTNSNNTQSVYDKKETTRNYEINETKEKIVAAPGSIKRITVAVLVDASINKAQQESLAKSVASAVGMNPARGDVISVETMPFSNELAEKYQKEEMEYQKQQNIYMWVKIGLGVLAALIAGYLILVLIRRSRSQKELSDVPQQILTQQAATVQPLEKELSTEEKEKAEKRKTIEKMAKSKPEDVANLIRAWLAED